MTPLAAWHRTTLREAASGNRTMHELSIVEALIEQTQRELQRAGQSGRIQRLDLTIGRLSGVSCDSIRFAFELLTPGTPLEKAEVHIREPKARCHCRGCNARVEIDELMIECPRCGSTEVSIEGGRELTLESIEIED